MIDKPEEARRLTRKELIKSENACLPSDITFSLFT